VCERAEAPCGNDAERQGWGSARGAQQENGCRARGPPGQSAVAEDAAGGDDGAEEFRVSKNSAANSSTGHGPHRTRSKLPVLPRACAAPAAGLEKIPEIFGGRRSQWREAYA